MDEIKKLRNIIKTSVYPEVANELLKAEGILQYDYQVITDNYLTNEVLTADSEISFHDQSDTEPVKTKETSRVVSIKNLLDSKTNY